MDFPITPAAGTTSAMLLGIALLTLTLAMLCIWFAWSASHLSVSIRSDTLQLHLPLYGRSIPISHLDLPNARIADIDSASSNRPTLRTNGIGLPGFGVGWFKLANGDKSLAALTSRQRVLYVPTTEGYSLLLSVTAPEQLLAQLRAPHGV